ncbi:MAG: peptide deformylase [Planctomycetes bacterium]|nr:peptide deformylase [Planctomycetota bacterium]
MAILKVARMGHPVLRRVADAVGPDEIGSDAIQRLIDDMIDTCREYDGAGLAAPQVHVSKRVVLLEISGNPRYPDAPDFPLTVVINPEVEPLDTTRQMVWEGCLSVPGLRGLVPRSSQVRLHGFDRVGQPLEVTTGGFPAAVVQHECDHLDGRLYVDRMESMESLSFLEEFDRHSRANADSPVNED